ncbi:MAG: carboxylating nicotinate-nucleotide diphosphorylase [candidate division Zixibacteria bacterium]|nr:carboxylating nicotinate-nucleotide diphosphorylase [candidate division Zixibacteria bacterium]
MSLAVRIALREDVGSGDRTTAALGLKGKSGRARVIARNPGILAGADCFETVFRRLDPKARCVWRIREGGRFRANDTIVIVRGRADALLTGERTALNFLGHLSGVATATGKLAQRIPRGTARLLDTRKTTPGLRLLEKRATRLGGAVNHRLGLYDALMIKDNHIAACGDLPLAIRRARRQRGPRPLVCEVRNLTEIRIALREGAGWLLLDNFTVARLRRAVRLIREFEREHHTRVTIEASGDVTARRIDAIARTGVRFISAGSITHSAPAVNFSMEWSE